MQIFYINLMNLGAVGNDFRLKETVRKKLFLPAPCCRPNPFTQLFTVISVFRHGAGTTRVNRQKGFCPSWNFHSAGVPSIKQLTTGAKPWQALWPSTKYKELWEGITEKMILLGWPRRNYLKKYISAKKLVSQQVREHSRQKKQQDRRHLTSSRN